MKSNSILALFSNRRFQLFFIAAVVVIGLSIYFLATFLIPAALDGVLFARAQTEGPQLVPCDPVAEQLITEQGIDRAAVTFCNVTEYPIVDREDMGKVTVVWHTQAEPCDGECKAVATTKVLAQDAFFDLREVRQYYKIFICDSVMYDAPNGNSYTLSLLPGEGGYGFQWDLRDYQYQNEEGDNDPACTLNGTLAYPFQGPLDDSQLSYDFDIEKCRANEGDACDAVQAAIDGDRSICDSFDPASQAKDHDVCFSYLSIFSEDTALCDSIGDAFLKSQCKAHVAIRRWDRSSCDLAENEDVKKECAAVFE